MSRKLKVGVLLLSFLFLGWFVFQPTARIGVQTPYLSNPAKGEELTAAELNEFLNLWSRILNGSLRPYLRQISVSNNQQYPQKLVKWLDNNNWSVERFFYDEQLIRGIVDCVNLKENIDSNIKLSKQGQNSLKSIIEEQKEQFKVCKYSDKEMALVRANLYQINEVFAGKAIMSKTEYD